MSLYLEYLMEQIAVIPIPSREWKVKKTRAALVYDDRDTARKKNQRKVDERLQYICGSSIFNYVWIWRE